MEHEHPQGIGRFAGAFWVAGWLASLPVSLAVTSHPARQVLVITGLGLLPGVVLLIAPWARLPGRWLHAVPIAATVVIALAISQNGDSGTAYAWFYLLVAIFVATAFRRRVVVAAHLALASLTLAAAVLLAPSATPQALGLVLASIQGIAVTALLVSFLRERLETHTHRDPLTGVGNYRFLRERLRYEIMRHERHRRQFAVMLLDLNDFKQVNEMYGHLEGDRLLRSVGRALMKAVRDEDTVARQGGDEFSVLLPETKGPGAIGVADRVEQALEQISVDGSPLTASVGLALFPRDGTTPDTLLLSADEVQRSNKRQRRSQAQAADQREQAAPSAPGRQRIAA